MHLDGRALGGLVSSDGRRIPRKPVPFKWTYHFSFGVAQFANAYEHLWPQVPTNKTVGVMWPNDADGNAIRGALGPLLKYAGYTIVDPGAYADGSTDYTAQISLFKSKNCEIFNTFPIPPDFVTFWEQAAQQGYKPKIAQIAKTGLFPSQVAGARFARQRARERRLLGTDLAVLLVAHRRHRRRTSRPATRRAPARSGTSRQARASRSSTSARGAQGERQPEGQAGGRDGDEDPAGRHAARTSRLGRTGTPPNVVATPIIGGQWVATPGTAYPINFVICENSNDSNVPIAATLTAYS